MQLCTALAVAHFSPAPSVVRPASDVSLCIAAMLTEEETQTVWTCVCMYCACQRRVLRDKLQALFWVSRALSLEVQK